MINNIPENFHNLGFMGQVKLILRKQVHASQTQSENLEVGGFPGEVFFQTSQQIKLLTAKVNILTTISNKIPYTC